MGRTTIEIDERTRDELRKYKAQTGLTYDEAIQELLEPARWVELEGLGGQDDD